MDYAYSPIENNIDILHINMLQRIKEPTKKIPVIYGKRVIKNYNKNKKLIRIKI